MKVTRIQAGTYKVEGKEETFICRKIHSFDFLTNKATQYWVANSCESVEECSDNNSCCENFKTFRELKLWLASFE